MPNRPGKLFELIGQWRSITPKGDQKLCYTARLFTFNPGDGHCNNIGSWKGESAFGESWDALLAWMFTLGLGSWRFIDEFQMAFPRPILSGEKIVADAIFVGAGLQSTKGTAVITLKVKEGEKLEVAGAIRFDLTSLHDVSAEIPVPTGEEFEFIGTNIATHEGWERLLKRILDVGRDLAPRNPDGPVPFVHVKMGRFQNGKAHLRLAGIEQSESGSDRVKLAVINYGVVGLLATVTVKPKT